MKEFLEENIKRLEKEILLEVAVNPERLVWKQGYNEAIRAEIAYYKRSLSLLNKL